MKTDIQSTTGGHWEVTCVIAMPPARTISLGQSNHVCMQARLRSEPGARLRSELVTCVMLAKEGS